MGPKKGTIFGTQNWDQKLFIFRHFPSIFHKFAGQLLALFGPWAVRRLPFLRNSLLSWGIPKPKAKAKAKAKAKPKAKAKAAAFGLAHDIPMLHLLCLLQWPCWQWLELFCLVELVYLRCWRSSNRSNPSLYKHMLASQPLREYLVLAGSSSSRGCHVYVW